MIGKEDAIPPDEELRSKATLFRELGYGGDPELMEAALDAAGLSNPWLAIIPVSRTDAVARLVEEMFLLVCSRPECRAEGAAAGDGRTVVPASEPRHCAFCGGSSNERAVARMLEACRARGWRRLCVVGGSPHARTALEELVGAAMELKLVDGTVSRTRGQAAADLLWADVVVVWGSTQLDHRVSLLYKGENVVQMARRSIAEVAKEVAKAAAGGGGAPPPPPPPRRRLLRGSLREGLVHGFLHLLRGEVLLVGREGPLVAEGVLDDAEAVAPEHVRRGHLHDGPCGDGPLDDGVHVGDVAVDVERGPAQRLRVAGLPAAHLGEVVAEVDEGVPDAELGVHEPAVGARHPHDLLRAEGLLVELHRVHGALHDDVGDDPLAPFRNRIHLGHGHASFLSCGDTLHFRRHPTAP